MQNLLKKLKSNKGGSELVSMIFITIFFLGLLISIIDTSMYMSNRSYINTAARDGARTIAIMGGAGDTNNATPIENAYGLTWDESCGQIDQNASIIAPGTNLSAYTPVECNIINSLGQNTGLVSTQITGVDCGPATTANIGERTFCEVKWTYRSLPMAPLGFINLRGDDGPGELFSDNVTSGSAESEVVMDGSALQPRGGKSK